MTSGFRRVRARRLKDFPLPCRESRPQVAIHNSPRLYTLCESWSLAAYLCLASLTFALQLPACAAGDNDDRDRSTYLIKPSQVDPNITRFNEPNWIVFDRDSNTNALLAVFLPGTGGAPANAKLLFGLIADQGYRVIGLEYNDTPGVVQVCSTNPSPSCSGDFRQRRAFGTGVTSVVSDTPAESIVSRLTNLLQYLQRLHPHEGWQEFLADNQPNWSRIVLSGLSQGAGMAAYIAKRERVARVVLFSSPWDFYGRPRALAPWILGPSATAPELWFAEYHRLENSADLIAAAYRGLGIPPANVRIFDRALPAGAGSGIKNKYHVSTIRDVGYIGQWRFLFGRSR